MFSKVALSILAVGALSVNALVVPVARSAAPQPECKFFPTPSHLDLTLVSFEAWSEWGESVGNYYGDKYKSPSAVPGLPQFKRFLGMHSSKPKGSKRQLEALVESSQDDSSPDPDTDDLHFFKRGLWSHLDHVLNPNNNKTYRRQLKPLVDGGHHFKSSDFSIPDRDDDHGAHHDSKREPSPEPETWEEWGTNIGNHYANKYGAPSQVPGLPRPWLNNKREPEAPAEWEPFQGFYPPRVWNLASRSEEGEDGSLASRKNSRRERLNQPPSKPVPSHPEISKGNDHAGDNHAGDNHTGGNHAGGK